MKALRFRPLALVILPLNHGGIPFRLILWRGSMKSAALNCLPRRSTKLLTLSYSHRV